MKKPDVDAEVGDCLIEVKIGTASLRNIRAGLLQLAYALERQPKKRGYLLLSDAGITESRIQMEWELARAVLNSDVARRVTIGVEKEGRLRGVLQSIDLDTKRVLLEVLEKQREKSGPRMGRSDASFVVLKVLLHHWLTDGGAVTSEWLSRKCGYTYPTVANALKGLGSATERDSSRRVRLRGFPHEEYLRLVAMSDHARATARYADASGQARSPERHLRRLEAMGLKAVGVGGVIGARHYFEDLDIVGAPRLDISFHARGPAADVDFIYKLDPALRQITDPREPASLVIHQVYHADPFFSPRSGGLNWADPVECLLDLHEAHLEIQAKQFLDVLKRRRPLKP
ncbi:MAG TPA: hypothetical protein VGG34_03170 [Opitutaceae bacterium]|jgi:hypothetical protein